MTKSSYLLVHDPAQIILLSSIFMTGRILLVDKTTLGSSAILGIMLAIMFVYGVWC